MITHTPPLASYLLINTLVARQQPTNNVTYMYVPVHIHTLLYLLSSAGWQKLDGVPFVARNAPRQENGIFLGIVVGKVTSILISSRDKAFFGRLLLLPCTLVVSPDAK